MDCGRSSGRTQRTSGPMTGMTDIDHNWYSGKHAAQLLPRPAHYDHEMTFSPRDVLSATARLESNLAAWRTRGRSVIIDTTSESEAS